MTEWEVCFLETEEHKDRFFEDRNLCHFVLMSSTKKYVFMSKQNYIILNICQNYSTKKVVAMRHDLLNLGNST